MVARLVRDPFDREGWLFELKWDGFRAIAEIDGADESLYRRAWETSQIFRGQRKWNSKNSNPCDSRYHVDREQPHCWESSLFILVVPAGRNHGWSLLTHQKGQIDERPRLRLSAY
jgi:hypothetical protein